MPLRRLRRAAPNPGFPAASRRSPEARAEIADSLLESLDSGPPDEGVEAAWAEEIKRRMDDIDSGKVQLIPSEEVRRLISSAHAASTPSSGGPESRLSSSES